MMKRRIALIALLVIMALGLIAASNVRYWSIKKGVTADSWLGHAGVHFDKSQFSGILRLARIGETNEPVEFTQKLLDRALCRQPGEQGDQGQRRSLCALQNPPKRV